MANSYYPHHHVPSPSAAGNPEEREACPLRAVLLGRGHGAAAPDEAADRDHRAGANGSRRGQEGTDHRRRVSECVLPQFVHGSVVIFTCYISSSSAI